MDDMPQIVRRKVQAETFARMFEIFRAEHGRQAALDLIGRMTREEAEEAGRSFAETAPDGPNLHHFSGVVDIWRAGDALDIARVQLEENRLSVEVTRCGYVEAYKAMGLADDLIFQLSCVRDGAFAQGYSGSLRLERPETISCGNVRCLFRYTWD